MKDFTDILRLCHELTEKIDVKIKVTKHLFSQQHLILPQSFYNTLMDNLGPNLVRLELDLPESIDSQAIIDYEGYVSLNKLCFFKITRGDLSKPQRKHTKVLE